MRVILLITLLCICNAVSPRMKKDGTPDMRFKDNRIRGRNMDGSLDMRFNVNKFPPPTKDYGYIPSVSRPQIIVQPVQNNDPCPRQSDELRSEISRISSQCNAELTASTKRETSLKQELDDAKKYIEKIVSEFKQMSVSYQNISDSLDNISMERDDLLKDKERLVRRIDWIASNDSQPTPAPTPAPTNEKESKYIVAAIVFASAIGAVCAIMVVTSIYRKISRHILAGYNTPESESLIV